MHSLWYFPKWIIFLRGWCYVLCVFWLFIAVVPSTLLIAEIWIGQIYIVFLYDGKNFDILKERAKDVWHNFLWIEWLYFLNLKKVDIQISIFSVIGLFFWLNRNNLIKFWLGNFKKLWLVASVTTNDVVSFLLIVLERYFALVENFINFIS